jgi:hypothetical protein
MPWSTLELDPSAATERDVKRAYAKRLKTCRPDQDPDGFRKLHDAYTTALDELQWREGGAGAPVAIANIEPIVATPDAVAPAAVLPEARAVTLSPGDAAVTGAFDPLEVALRESREGVEGLVRAFEQVLYEYPAETSRWGSLMFDLIEKYGTHSDLRLKPEAMLFELEHGGGAATLAIIERLDRQGSPQGIASLANLLLENQRRIAGPGAGLAAARLAGAAAFWVKRQAAPLADFAYEHLARGERDYHMHMIDQHRAMGDLLYLVPDRLKSYWRQRLMHTPGVDSWDDDESREALAWLRSSTARSSDFFPVLFGLLPEAVAAKLNLNQPPSIHPKRPASAAPARPQVPRRPAEVPEWDRDPDQKERVRHRAREIRDRQFRQEHGGGRGVWSFVVLVIFLIKVAVIMSRCSG